MGDILECLCKLNFTSLEAKIYITLLERGKQSGYQIAKKINMSRPSVYAALNHMYEQGSVLLLSEDVQIYEAQNPVILFSQLKKQFSKNADFALSNLQHLYENKREERFTNLKGFDTIVANVKSLLQSAEKEVYMNTDFDLQLFSKEFKTLRERNVRIVIFSFSKLDHDGLDIEFYTHNDPICEEQRPSRIMLVADIDVTIVADKSQGKDNWFGTITNNALMVSIMAEHIHNDIYLLKLKQKYGKNIMDDKILLDTMLERR
ncbi:TrmB family transcriptional regulator [Clostridium oryzae]|uniref:Sugar-specific transcriptional regulator TrmB n=1 Tax=Clostridium oryzae TaxID=1450648 RepID=A0A1V4IEZ9_9CLOT|nr:TrmB family transcriptional regulator [Clostridium oryzae]OPJ58561.1 sugar-specific transcriptional regulator TrmB [Clostridium oryzae]